MLSVYHVSASLASTRHASKCTIFTPEAANTAAVTLPPLVISEIVVDLHKVPRKVYVLAAFDPVIVIKCARVINPTRHKPAASGGIRYGLIGPPKAFAFLNNKSHWSGVRAWLTESARTNWTATGR